MRQFYLTNGKSTVKYLAKPSSKIFLNEPKGLGFTQTLETFQFGNRLNANASANFGTIDGEVVFYNDSMGGMYDKYNSFVTFLMDKPLVLSYILPTSPAQTYTMDVEVLSLGKTEIQTDGCLHCDLSLQGLSRWKGAEVTSTGSSSTYTLTNSGHMPVGFSIEITGTAMVNPYFTLEQNSEIYGEAKFIDTTGFSKVKVDSNDGQQNVILEQGGSALPNPLGYQDLSISNGSIYVTFVKLARGTSTLTIGMDSGSLTSATIKFTPIYASV